MTGWSKIAGVYGPVMRAAGWQRAQAHFAAGQRQVLDVGCGNAFLATVVGPGYTGVDRSLAMVVRAPAGARVLVADARALPFADQTFDVVMSTGFLGLLTEPQRASALSEMARVCRRQIRLLEPVEGVTHAKALALARHPVRGEELRTVGFEPVVGSPVYFGLYAPVTAMRKAPAPRGDGGL